MSSKQVYEIELTEEQATYLEGKVAEHGFPDISKAIRILIEFARQEKQHTESIFTEIRCRGC